MTAFVAKDVEGVVTWGIDWAANWLDSGESVISTEISVQPDEGSPGGLQVDGKVDSATTTDFRISAGEVGKVYRVQVRARTDFNNAPSRDIVVIIGDSL